jgi:hypothetical protein
MEGSKGHKAEIEIGAFGRLSDFWMPRARRHSIEFSRTASTHPPQRTLTLIRS